MTTRVPGSRCDRGFRAGTRADVRRTTRTDLGGVQGLPLRLDPASVGGGADVHAEVRDGAGELDLLGAAKIHFDGVDLLQRGIAGALDRRVDGADGLVD